MSIWSEIGMTVRYARGLPGFLRHPLSPADCRRFIADHMAARSQSFLSLLARGVFGQFQSPYRALFEAAGIDFPTVERLTRDHGVDGALERLYEAGVWLKLEEFKGRRPIERAGLRLEVRAEDFDNPLMRPQFEGRTGGSRGKGRRLLLDLDLLTHDAACHYIHLESFNFVGGPMGMWRPVPPDNSGVKKALMHARMGGRLDRWFTQSPIRVGGGQFKFFLFTWHTVAGFRLYGGEKLVPEYTPFAEAGKVARWLAQQRERGRPAYLDTHASAAVRVCKAAAESGLDIRGTLFRAGGEPLTPGKVRVIENSGCRVVCHYSMSELGHVGMACAAGTAVDDVHVLQSKVAVIQRGNGAFHVTSLDSSTPKLMLNVETGDSGVIERRQCGCPFGDVGFDQHLSGIRSYEKLTSEGIQFLGMELIELLEEVLPAAFAGSPADYQLVEEEQEGLPKVSLVVSPRVGPVDEIRLVRTALDFLAEKSVGHELMAKVWDQGRTLHLVRREPYVTAASKILPLHVRS